MKQKTTIHDLKINDYIYDLNGEDSQGLGKGQVIKFNDSKTFFFVKFEEKENDVLFNEYLFRFDRAGIKGSRRALTEKEFIKYLKYGFLRDSEIPLNIATI